MPVYEFECECGHSSSELVWHPHDTVSIQCPSCGCQMARAMSRFSTTPVRDRSKMTPSEIAFHLKAKKDFEANKHRFDSGELVLQSQRGRDRSFDPDFKST